jgi:carboxyl-terminal processing protease
LPILLQLTSFARSQNPANLESFEIVWRTVRDEHPDRTFNGLDWQKIHDEFRPRIAAATSNGEARAILREMLERLGTSHYAIIPAERYNGGAPANSPPGNDQSASRRNQPGTDQGARRQPLRPQIVEGEPNGARSALNDSPAQSADQTVTFGNLPGMRLSFESRTLDQGIGYIRFNEFLDPATLMPRFETALRGFSHAPGIILDLRGNPGGIALMAMGIAGFFVEKPGEKLGEMHMRSTTLKLTIFPRPGAYKGPLAILVDGATASTSEILAQGLQDLKRARIFGTRTAGAALPSDIIRLPNGDGFEYPEATLISESGKTIEGIGVTPDVFVSDDRAVEAAEEWIRSRK